MEVGPGQGALTGLLLERASRVVAVEIDHEMAQTLPTRVDADRLVILERDILRTDLEALAAQLCVTRWPIIGNLPYVISSRLLMRLVEQARVVERVTMMVQREVGERILAGPGSRTYGLLSALLQATGRLSRCFRVAPGAFRPVPSVQSLVFTWRSDVPDQLNIPALIRTAKAAFGQRRKRLDNALKRLPGADRALIADACQHARIDPALRAEHLGSDEYIRLSASFERLGVFRPGEQ
jgi:16S rRNA (adenine1518-N6/adenine1519-N6)-dimethyltransferase